MSKDNIDLPLFSQCDFFCEFNENRYAETSVFVHENGNILISLSCNNASLEFTVLNAIILRKILDSAICEAKMLISEGE